MRTNIHMFKQLLTGTVTFTLLITVGIPSLAQSPEIVAQSQLKQVSKGEVSPQEVQQFSSAIVKLQLIQRQYRGAIIGVIEQEGFSPERFVAIIRSEQEQKPLNPELTNEERQNLSEAITQIQEIQQKTQLLEVQVVQEEGLGVERFEELIEAVEESSELQSQVRQEVKRIIESLSAPTE